MKGQAREQRRQSPLEPEESGRELVVHNLTHAYSPGIPVLSEISFRLESAERIAILGASGSGKSTLLRILCGLEPISQGTIRLGTETLAAPQDGMAEVPAERRPIGLVFQDYALFPHLSALENILFALPRPPLTVGRKRALLEREQNARAYLQMIGLADAAGRLPETLSGGQRQRLALARALAHGPEILLLDEPFSGLDQHLRVKLRRETAELLSEKKRGAILVTHDIDEALEFASRILILNAGRIEQIGSRRELLEQPKSLHVARLFGNLDPLTLPQSAREELRKRMQRKADCSQTVSEKKTKGTAHFSSQIYFRTSALRPKTHESHPGSDSGIDLNCRVTQIRYLSELIHVSMHVRSIEFGDGQRHYLPEDEAAEITSHLPIWLEKEVNTSMLNQETGIWWIPFNCLFEF